MGAGGTGRQAWYECGLDSRKAGERPHRPPVNGTESSLLTALQPLTRCEEGTMRSRSRPEQTLPAAGEGAGDRSPVEESGQHTGVWDQGAGVGRTQAERLRTGRSW